MIHGARERRSAGLTLYHLLLLGCVGVLFVVCLCVLVVVVCGVFAGVLCVVVVVDLSRFGLFCPCCCLGSTVGLWFWLCW